MTLSELADLAEIVGGVAVVVSLIYLAVQVRQNTHSVRSATLQANTALWSSIIGNLGDPGSVQATTEDVDVSEPQVAEADVPVVAEEVVSEESVVTQDGLVTEEGVCESDVNTELEFPVDGGEVASDAEPPSDEAVTDAPVDVSDELDTTDADPLAVKDIMNSFARFEVVSVTPEIINSAIDCSILNRLSFWDALIVAAAESAHCEYLWTEDLNAGQVIRGVKVENPLVP